MAKLIGLHGKMHTGKSAVAKLIKQKDPNRIEIMSFAGKLREVLNVLGIQETSRARFEGCMARCLGESRS